MSYKNLCLWFNIFKPYNFGPKSGAHKFLSFTTATFLHYEENNWGVLLKLHFFVLYQATVCQGLNVSFNLFSLKKGEFHLSSPLKLKLDCMWPTM